MFYVSRKTIIQSLRANLYRILKIILMKQKEKIVWGLLDIAS